MPSKVYYNSACPVCKAGINDQRARMQACGITDVVWIDVHTQPQAVTEVGATLEQVRERLYVRGSDGQLNIGVDAISQLWSQTRGQRMLGKLLRVPLIKQLAHLAYNCFARLLYRWNRAQRHW